MTDDELAAIEARVGMARLGDSESGERLLEDVPALVAEVRLLRDIILSDDPLAFTPMPAAEAPTPRPVIVFTDRRVAGDDNG